MTEIDEIISERRGGAAWITLNRPKDLNAMSRSLIEQLGAALNEAEADSQTLCVVVTGAGRAFCAGADLKFINDLPPDLRNEATQDFLATASALMSRIECFAKPVIAAVNGIATAGGMEIVLCCDLVIASEAAKLGDGHANFGLLPGAGASVRLPRKIGMNAAKYLFFTGELVDAADPMLSGLVNEVVPANDLTGAVDALVAKLEAKSPLGLRRMKELANAAPDLTVADGLTVELTANELHTSSYDRNEGLTAFNERRKPAFAGR